MNSYFDLISSYKHDSGSAIQPQDVVHAIMAAYPDRIEALKNAVESLLDQVDTFYVFLNNFTEIPQFLDQEKVYLTRSQDFGNLGECGKYYWCDDLEGYVFICSDKLIYPPDYVKKMIRQIENHGRKAVIGAGGWNIMTPFKSFSESAIPFIETEANHEDASVPLLDDLALAYHSSTLKVSRHYFFQPELSALWFSIIAKEQNVPLICCRHKQNWLAETGRDELIKDKNSDGNLYKTFLVKCHFTVPAEKEKSSNTIGINTYFDKIYVMNLDRRPDRWEKIKKIAAKYHVNITRFPAVDGYLEPVKSAWENYFASGCVTLPEGIEPLADYKDKFRKYHHYVARIHFMETKLNRKAMQSPGAWGYALSYIAILKEAIVNDYNRILIFDDDIVFHKSFNDLIGKYLDNLPEDWKLIMPGAMQHYWEPWITKYSDLLYHCHGSSVASHAVGIDRKVFLPLIYYCEKLDLPVDEGAIFHIQNVYSKQCFIFRPNLVIQDMRESDINTSTMKQQQAEEWMKLFQWNIDDYDFM
jgi:GR25 family glycosyltransferase involved in LPS biosynthesis